jgi:hypothetical protein
VSISSISQASLFATKASTGTATDLLASALSNAPAASPSTPTTASTATAGPAGSTDPFAKLAAELQAFLLQMQGGSAAATTTAGAATNASATDASASADVDDTSGTTQAPPLRHHHHSGAQETGSPSQLQADATSLLNDLTGGTGSSSSATASTSTASTAATASNVPASFLAAFRAYSGAGAQSSTPTQLGFA